MLPEAELICASEMHTVASDPPGSARLSFLGS